MFTYKLESYLRMQVFRLIGIAVLMLSLCSAVAASRCCAQQLSPLYFEALNSRIEQAVVIRDTTFLDSVYADDFVFSHGSGRVDSKASWLRNVARTTYPTRVADSTTVEMHRDCVVLTGRTIIHRTTQSGDVGYGIQYVRVFVLRGGRWQLVSHRTIRQWNLDE
jgi:hypothetical protein